MYILNKDLAKEYLNQRIDENSFYIGNINIFDNDDFVIRAVDKNYNELKKIYNAALKELDSNSEIIDWSFRNKILTKIKLRFFPRWEDFTKLFNSKMDYRNEYLSELSCWVQNDQDRDTFVHELKPSKLFYKHYVQLHGPEKLKGEISQNIPIALNMEDLTSHSFTVARSGSGKSVLILEIMKNIIKNKQSSLILLEPHGDLSDELISYVDSKDLVYIDPFLQKNYIPTINIFEIDDKSIENISIYAGVIVDVFKQIIGGAFSPAMQSLLTPMVSVLLQIDNSSFFDMLRFMDDSKNKELLKFAQEHALNPSHRLYFKTHFLENRASATKYSIATKLQVLLQDPIFANMLTGKSTIDLEKMINTKGKIIIIRLNTVKMTETIAPIGKFLTAIITAYAFKREHQDVSSRIMTHFFIDEAPVFLGDSISIILEQARKFGLSLHLVSQYNYQLGTDINTSVLSNTSLKFIGINSHKNNILMGSEIGVPVEELDALRKKGEFYVKVGTKKAFKFKVFYEKKDSRSKLMYDPVVDSMISYQLIDYYRKVDLSDIEYAHIPQSKKTKDETKPYSKQSAEDLLSKIDNDDELLDY